MDMGEEEETPKERVKPEMMDERDALQFLSPITRFRAVVRKVINNLSWLTEEVEQAGMTSNILLNVRMLTKQKKTPGSGLSFEVKCILMKRIRERTEEELQMLWRTMKGLKCFKRYPDDVKRKLTSVAKLVLYGPGRVVVRQGQYAHATYFISSGDIVISIRTWDALNQEFVSIDVGIMGPGDMFGEVSLLHDVPRTATCTTTSECSLLVLEREHFTAVLKATLTSQWDEIMDALKKFPYFETLGEVASRECCILSQLVSYEPHEIILGYDIGKCHFTHFLLSGECQVIEELKVVVLRKRGCSYPQRLYKEGAPLCRGEAVEIFFMNVYNILKGQCFSIGENLENRAVVALTPVKCLLIPSQWMKQYNPHKIWDRIRHYFARQIPSKQDAFNLFLANRTWVKNTNNLIKNMLKQQRTLYLDTSRHDIPCSIRIFEDIGPHRRGYKQ